MSPLRSHRSRLALLCLGVALLVTLMTMSGAALLAQAPAEPTPSRPLEELYLPLIVKQVGRPFPTDPPLAPTLTPTATSTRRPTITPTTTATTTGPAGPTLTPTASPTLRPGVTPSRTPSPTVTATATPSGRVTVLNSQVYRRSAGSQPVVHVVGELRNDTQSPITQVSAPVRLLRDDGLELTTVYAEVLAGVLAPGQTAPFRAVVDEPAEFDSAVVVESGIRWAWSAGAPQPPLAAPTRVAQTTGFDAQLLGQVTNTSGGVIAGLRVVAVYRDASGAVTNVVDSGLGSASPFGLVIGPGQSTPFRIALGGLPSAGTPQFNFLYDPTNAPAPAPLATQAVNVLRGTGQVDLFGEVVNTTAGPIYETQVIASFLDASGKLVDAQWVWASQNADRVLNPGAAAPFWIAQSGAGVTAWQRYELQTFHRPAASALPTSVTVEPAPFRVSTDYLTLTLSGRVVNGSTATLRQPRLVVTFTKEGKVVYWVAVDAPEVEGLAPGGSVTFALSVSLPRAIGQSLEGSAATYVVDFRP